MTDAMRVLVTRPAGQEQGLCALVEAGGAEAIHLPAIEILPPEDTQALTAAIDSLELLVGENDLPPNQWIENRSTTEDTQRRLEDLVVQNVG